MLANRLVFEIIWYFELIKNVDNFTSIFVLIYKTV